MSDGRREKRPSPATTEVAEEEGEPTPEAPTLRHLAVDDDYLQRIPKVILPPEEVNAADLDPREYFLLSLLDGSTTIENLLDISGMSSEDALALLEELVRRGIVAVPG